MPARKRFRLILGLIKLLSALAGLPATLLCAMALIGVATGNVWLRGLGAILIAFALPLLLADRLLPSADQERARGLVSDTLVLCWLAIPVVVAGLAHQWTRDPLAVEADRLAASGWQRAAKATYWLASVRPERATPERGRSATARKAQTPVAAPEGTAEPAKGASPQTKRERAATNASPGGSPGARADAGPDAASGAPAKYTPAELFRKFAPAVVSIKVGSARAFGQAGGGTGFLIDDAGTIATNSHVIHDARVVAVKVKGGDWINKVQLLVEDEKADLALMRIPADRLPPALELADSNTIQVGERVVAIGNPLGLEHTLTDGLVSARRVYQGRKWIQMSTPISPGNSGGPLFNQRGHVVGVTTAQIGSFLGRAQNLNLAVPINELKRLLKSKYPNQRSVGSEQPDMGQTW
jgi:serine protease Do